MEPTGTQENASKEAGQRAGVLDVTTAKMTAGEDRNRSELLPRSQGR